MAKIKEIVIEAAENLAQESHDFDWWVNHIVCSPLPLQYWISLNKDFKTFNRRKNYV